MNESFYSRSQHALRIFREEYSQQHQTRINRQLHLYGRIIRVAALLLCLFELRRGIPLFFAGWGIQLLGHVIEGSPPSFLRNPRHLLLGALSYPVSLIELFRIRRKRAEGPPADAAE